MKALIVVLLLCNFYVCYAQPKRLRLPVWTYHQRNVDIYGVSVGLASVFEPRNANTTGIKIELIGTGILMPLMSQSPVAKDDSSFHANMKEPASEKVSGISLSATGTACDCVLNGISLGTIGHIERQVTGLSAAVILNLTQIHKGIQFSIGNEAYEMTGLQIGLVNTSRKTKGIQIGLWNVNERRKFPIINWKF